MHCTIPGLLLVALLAATAPAQSKPDGSPDTLFYRAYYDEVALRDFAKSAQEYEGAFEAAVQAKRDDLTARCLVGRGRCFTAMGKVAEAEQAFQAALKVDPKCEEAKAALANRKQGDANEPELDQRIDVLIAKLAGEERDTARKDLEKIGSAAIPRVVLGLRSRDVATAEGCALILIRTRAPGPSQELAQAIRSGELLFTAVIPPLLSFVPPNDALLAVYEVLLAQPSAEVRLETAQMFAASFNQQSSTRADVTEAIQRLLDRLARSEDARIATNLLARSYSSGIAPLLEAAALDAMARPEVEVRRAAVQFFARNDEAQRSLDVPKLKRLAAALADPDSDVRTRLADLVLSRLRSLDRDESRRQCRELLGHPDPIMVARAAKELRELGRELLDEATIARLVASVRRAITEPMPEDARRDLVEGVIGSVEMKLPDLMELYVLAGAPQSLLPDSLRAWARAKAQQRMQQLLTASDHPARTTIESFLVDGLSGIGDAEGRRQWVAQWAGAPQDNNNSGWLPMTALFVRAAAVDDGAIRPIAYSELRNRGADGSIALPWLAKDLLTDDLKSRESLLWVAGTWPDPSFVPSLRQRFADAKDPCRATALWALVENVHGEASPEIESGLQASDRQLFQRAVESLVKVAADAAVPRLVAIAIERKEARIILDALIDDHSSRLRVAPEILAAFVDQLPAALVDADLLPRVERWVPALALHQLLVTAIHSSNVDLQWRAIDIAGRQKIDDLWPELVPFLDAPNGMLRNAAADALQAIRSFRELRRSLVNGSEESAAKALVQVKAMLASGDPAQRRGAALALGVLGDRATLPLLLDLIKDGDEAVRDAALRALDHFGERTGEKTPEAALPAKKKQG